MTTYSHSNDGGSVAETGEEGRIDKDEDAVFSKTKEMKRE